MEAPAKNVLERVLDFSDCEYLGEIHKIIKTQLDLPDWYGSNLDALLYALTGIMYVPVNIQIIYKPKNKASLALKDEVIKKIEVFKEAVSEYNEFKLTVNME